MTYDDDVHLDREAVYCWLRSSDAVKVRVQADRQHAFDLWGVDIWRDPARAKRVFRERREAYKAAAERSHLETRQTFRIFRITMQP